MIKEISYEILNKNITAAFNGVVLVYTNMCGTCESAKTMLNVVSQTGVDIEFYKINTNLHAKIIQEYNVKVIPCFLLFSQNILVEQFYAFYSVTNLYQKARRLI